MTLNVNTTRLQVLRTTDDDLTCQTFVMQEDHTLGNALRYIIMKNPEVKFCGYNIPHPLENKIHFRIQTYKTSAQDVLRKGLMDLQQLCQHIMDTFEEEVVRFKGEPNTTSSDKMET